jgi:hypothetical protein
VYGHRIFKSLFAKSNKHKAIETIPDITYKRINPWKTISTLTGQIGQITAHYNNAQAELARYERITQDILHVLELANDELSEKELISYTEDLIAVRIQRRKIKDFIELATPICRVLEEYPCIKKEFKKATNEVKQIQEQHKLRKYNPRELKQTAHLFKSNA